MKKIICFGDSNTYGFNPENGSRYDSNTRWTGVLARLLGESFEVIEEGCNNRTLFFKNPDGELQSGQRYLPKCLEKNDFDVFILALGTNDLQKFFGINEEIVRDGLKNTINFIRKSNPDAVIITIPPVILSENILRGYFCCQFDEKSIESSHSVQKIYEEVSKNEGCELLDLNKFVTPSDFDGLHFSAESHNIIAAKIAQFILNEECACAKLELKR